MTTFIERPRTTCTLGGALAALTALPNVVPIIHASGGCGSSISTLLNQGAGYAGSGYSGGNMIPCSNVVEKEIVFGGENRIDELIQGTTEILEAELYFVVTGCMVEMIGDDVLPIVNKYAQKGVNILAASTPGFKGNLFTGYDIVLQTLAENYVEKTEVKELHTVNILGVIPKQDVFFKGNLDEIKRLLSKLGIKANTFYGQGETLQNLRHAGKASLNIVLSDIYGINVAQTFKEIHGIPYITADLPIGDTGTALFLRKVAETLQIDPQLVNAVIAEEKAYYYSYLERLLETYADFDLQRYAIVAADSNYAFPLLRFVSDDLGWIPYLAYISDILEDWQLEKVRSNFSELQSGKPNVIFTYPRGTAWWWQRLWWNLFGSRNWLYCQFGETL
ncbi:MAG: nitrogenase component 1 [Chloroflexota bacterium]|nr:hypothetical protein [Chloroflexota bacterium]